ncbi:isochorismatase family protein [Bartonella queenslandensis]|uniref:isochorismatase family protein n=1 Tax=Bartonella queenslandensis TaxID=481138 RepID=UPI001BAD4802|nr:isochorismatase family protein [Bartonella queenslandensis]
MHRTLESESYCFGELTIPVKQPLCWTIEPDYCAVLVHDMQSYFVHALPDSSAVPVICSIAKILKWARKKHVPVFYSAQPGGMTPQERGLLNDLWGPGMRTTEEDRKIIAELAPCPEDTLLTKWRYSAFYKSSLAERLEERQCNSLIITGIYASVGIFATAVEAFTRDIKPFVIADAVADFSLVGHQQTIDYLANNCARVLSVNEVTKYE